jgi:hypothetical protein
MLYRCGDEICIELSIGALDHIQRAIGAWLKLPANRDARIVAELEQFANELRAEIQHRDKPKTVDNSDLV